MDKRPPVWIGHIGPHIVPDVDDAITFYETVGMRTVAQPTDMAIMELRGGTHLILRKGEPFGEPAPFDLMVDDLDATHAAFAEHGLKPSEIRPGSIHNSFTITDPGGAAITINSSHAVGPV